MKITVAHSPDSDDAFMFYALTHGRIDTEGMSFEHRLQDIQKCNEEALAQKYDVTAISVAAWPDLAGNYRIMNCGASMGEKEYGPVLVARKRMIVNRETRIAVPGEKTSAVRALRLAFGAELNTRVVPFDQIPDSVLSGEAQAGLLIHEGQLTFGRSGLVEIFNFGRWWWDKEGLPLPLGVNAIRKSLPEEIQRKADRLLGLSIRYALDHPDEALDYALRFARGLQREEAEKFVAMYVNRRTLSLGPEEKKSITRFLGRFPEYVG